LQSSLPFVVIPQRSGGICCCSRRCPRLREKHASKYLKKKSKLWHIFSPPQNGHPLTTIHHQSTTTSPQKHHTKNAHFPKPPSKTPAKAQKKAPANAGTFFSQNQKIKR
jgi:hypothetical protein